MNYLAESVIVNSPILFTQYVSWLRKLLEGFDITQEDLTINFRLIQETLVEHFRHPDKTMVLQHLDLGIQETGKKEEYASFITNDNPLAADVVAISATMTYHVHLVKELIAFIRQNAATCHVRILVGGLPFNLDPRLWQEIGADGCAPDAEEALEVAEHLLSSRV
ncbi:hypothetical protein ASL14_01855 [Paenibacillus sp. IHB B 3084]|uniref:cobalamin B12-binding domain-containing protein n=1 Tax=Paenibacillus sp. IHB B 3084 TaxID=867076 RepID=UPI00071F5D5F|nr:cobalamin B12-binding domain-containing protein [Paenibacillus sp. IHB B 3084]ALP35108.1 hypothetical protein ASL14_01855 [Paenibacillus sp. IHB B 3084]